MKLIVAISILTVIRAENNQGIYIINGVRHYSEILFENIHRDFNYRDNNLVVDYKTNNLYVDWYATAEAAVYHIDTKEFKPITGLSSPQCVTVDQFNNDIFIGTSSGVYKYYDTTGAVELFGYRGEDVWRIYHYNGVLYYRRYGESQEIRMLVNGQSLRYHYFGFDIRQFVVDSEENMYCTSYNGSLYRYKDATKHTFLYEGIPAVKSLTTDRNGNVYFSVDDGIYKVKGDSVERVVSINDTRYIAFDSDHNLIYYNNKENKLCRLKPINIPNSCTDRQSHIQELEVTNNNDIKSELQILNKKVDNLPQVMNMLLTNIMEKQLAHSDSPKNVSIGLDESGMAQIPSTSPTINLN